MSGFLPRRASDALIAKARWGEPVSLSDKLATIDTVEELDGFVAALRERDQGLWLAEAGAIALRRVEIIRKTRKVWSR